MIEFVKGDFFDYDADIRVNTVNCVGVMGAGVALAFKNKYPNMFKEYAKQCRAKEIAPGRPSVWMEGDMFSKGIEIINFPTKDHWRTPSEYEYVEKGLAWLSEYLLGREGVTVTLPALGCGHGGLDWEKVKLLILKYLSTSPSHILVFEPQSSKNAGKKRVASSNKTVELEELGIKTVSFKSDVYPPRLSRYTEKDLYVLGKMVTDFDIAIISSTKPSEEEKSFVLRLISYCQDNSYSILFGGSAFDKKMANFSMKQGIITGVFLPSGISDSAIKMRMKGIEVNISVLSIGDPSKAFDRKEYLPSVLSRFFISRFVVFTTGKLKWLEKQNKIISKNEIISYFAHYEDLLKEDFLAAVEISSTPLKVLDCDNSSFDLIKPNQR
ncbi:hypothetical protein A9263_04500 [Vibrio cyclitrophicus]|uniref:type II toxin-antitoxin system antitoxin DNA ADP-ribosyl glycohydrolase DarG n=1 Tax=Vibrio cyclitrophicus TaxID=47951 RepID=UPI0007EEC5B5|nr:macro domain-containing protein [Vibrio cyclitrophicus]OBT29323.1 hypothetical protein A9263_04500 [Vibrio cyclitrophicus]